MSRRRRTIEILAAAQLAPQELAMERERTRRQGATTQAALQALSMLPTAAATLGRTFADVEADKLAAAEKTKAAEAKRVADEEARNRQKALDALTEENTRSQIQAREAEQGRAAAAEGRAAAQAEATTKKSALEEAKAAREAAMDALRARARAGVALPTLIGAAASDDRLGDLDDDAVAGVLAEEQAKAKQQDATTLKTLEQAKPKPVAPPRRAPGGGGGSGAPPKAKEPPQPKQQPLPAEVAKERSLKVTGLELVNKLREAKKKVGTGPIEGRIADLWSNVQQNPERREFLQLNNAVQRIVGRILEGGKLAEGDARNYERFILDPNTLDDDEYDALLNSVEEQLRSDLTNFDSEMTASGRTVGAPPPRSNRPGAPDPAAAAEADALFAD